VVTKSRWHQLQEAILGSNLPASDKAVFLFLLTKTDFGTAHLPAGYTPTQAEIARKISFTERQVRRAERHLEHHGWLEVGDAKRAGPGRTRSLALAFGAPCDCKGRVHER
jgi:hypothetical protein